VDFLLNYSFYARQNTRTPAIVGVISVGLYFIVAASLKGPFGYLGLVFADSVKQAGHALIMVILLLRSVGRPHDGIGKALIAAIGAAVTMGAAVWLLSRWLTALLPESFLGELLVVAVSAGVGGILYLAVLRLFGIPEVVTLINSLRGRLRRARSAP
jgi:putative peptidoglycan lipid II flippase